MNTQSTTTLRSIRVLLVTLALALASIFGTVATDVSADVLIPEESVGAPGGGGGIGETEDEDEVVEQAKNPHYLPA